MSNQEIKDIYDLVPWVLLIIAPAFLGIRYVLKRMSKKIKEISDQTIQER